MAKMVRNYKNKGHINHISLAYRIKSLFSIEFAFRYPLRAKNMSFWESKYHVFCMVARVEQICFFGY